jgi:acetyl esterase/lipase
MKILKITIIKLYLLSLFLFSISIGNLYSKTIANQDVKTISLDSLLRGPLMSEIVIKKVNNEEVKLFYIKPIDNKPIKKRTAVVWIHGGGWTGGITETFFPHARYFACRGAVGFCIHYRLVKADGSVMVGDCLADCKSAIRYIREHAAELGIDPNKIIVLGESAGGHLASCLGTIDGFDDPLDNLKASAIPNALVLYNPLSDFTTSVLINRIIGGAALDKKTSPENLIPTKEQIELAKRLSPLYNVHKNQPPTLVLHGLDDTVILPEQSVKFTEAMKKYGNKCELILLPNTTHAFVCANYKSPEDVVIAALLKADKFLISLGLLKGKPTLVISKQPAWKPKGQTK